MFYDIGSRHCAVSEDWSAAAEKGSNPWILRSSIDARIKECERQCDEGNVKAGRGLKTLVEFIHNHHV